MSKFKNKPKTNENSNVEAQNRGRRYSAISTDWKNLLCGGQSRSRGADTILQIAENREKLVDAQAVLVHIAGVVFLRYVTQKSDVLCSVWRTSFTSCRTGSLRWLMKQADGYILPW